MKSNSNVVSVQIPDKDMQAILEKSHADLIALEECDLRFLRPLLQLPWVRENYYLSESGKQAPLTPRL